MAHVTLRVKFDVEFETDCEAVDEESALNDIALNGRLTDELLIECYDNMSVIAGSYDEEEPEDDEDFEDEDDEDLAQPEGESK